jgi:hypothetical protein
MCPVELSSGAHGVVQTSRTTVAVEMLEEGFNLTFKIAEQEVVFKWDAVLKGLVLTFDPALSCGCSGVLRTRLIS